MSKCIAIAGGGLAGLSLGIALRLRGVDVEIHEAATYPRHKVCGEFLSGVGENTLEALGISECLADARRLETAIWRDSSGCLGEFAVNGSGISRWRLDERLKNRFEALGGRMETSSRLEPGEGVVWAAGRPNHGGPWVGLKCHARNLHLEADLEMFSGPGGYAGLAKIEDGLVNVCGLFRTKLPRGAKGPALLMETARAAGLDSLAAKLQAAELDDSSFRAVAGFRTGRQAGPEFSIGDAANMIPPFTGNGMSMAFESAECALKPVMAYATGELGWNEAASACSRGQRGRFRNRLAVSSAMHWIATTPLGHRLAGALGRRRLIPFKTLLRAVR